MNIQNRHDTVFDLRMRSNTDRNKGILTNLVQWNASVLARGLLRRDQERYTRTSKFKQGHVRLI